METTGKSSRRWTPESEEDLIRRVKSGRLVPDWGEIASALGRTSAVCKTRYTDIVLPLDQVHQSVARVSNHDVYAVLSEKRSTCIRCGSDFYYPPHDSGHGVECCTCSKIHTTLQVATTEHSYKCDTCSCEFNTLPREWRGSYECPGCYGTHANEKDLLWKTIIDPRMRCCFCERDTSCGIPFEFDHKNMFEKGDSICMMIGRGQPIEIILEEIKKCQTACK
jgi:hypothetical protein